MLARHAEDLFWAGRYLERVQDTARFLDVTYHTLLSSPYPDSPDPWSDLLATLLLTDDYRERHGEPDPARAHEFLVLDLDNAGSVISLAHRARENTRRVRELVSTEMWEAVNDAWLELRSRDIRRELEQHPANLYAFVRQRAQAVVGVAAETMPRDEGWHFLQLGVQVERASLTARLVAVHARRLLPAPVGDGISAWSPALRSASGSEAFLRSGAATTPAGVVRFLLLSARFPRSVLFALREADRLIAAVTPAGEMSNPRRLLGQSRATLEFCDLDALLLDDLAGFLDELDRGIRSAASAVAGRYFHRPVEGGLQSQEIRALALARLSPAPVGRVVRS